MPRFKPKFFRSLAALDDKKEPNEFLNYQKDGSGSRVVAGGARGWRRKIGIAKAPSTPTTLKRSVRS